MATKIHSHYYSRVVGVDDVADYLNDIQKVIEESDSWSDEIVITPMDEVEVLVVVKVCTIVE